MRSAIVAALLCIIIVTCVNCTQEAQAHTYKICRDTLVPPYGIFPQHIQKLCRDTIIPNTGIKHE